MVAEKLPEAEVLERLPFEKYIDMPAIHATGLRDLLVSPLMYKARRDTPRPDTDSLRLGRACHTAILEPDTFMTSYLCWLKSQGVRRGKSWDAFNAGRSGRTILTEAQYKLALKLRDACRDHELAGRYLSEKGRPELTLKWTHPRTGLPCKSRIDWLCSALIDVKTTRNPSPAKFSGDAARFGYVMQLAFYADAVAAAGFGVPPVKIMAVQNVEPYDVVVFDISEESMAFGRKQYENAIDLLIKCRESNKWPGIAASAEVGLNLPAWATTTEADEPITFGDEIIA